MVPNVQSPTDVQAHVNLLRRVAAAIDLTGATLVEVCQRVVSDAQAEVAPIDGVARLAPSSDTAEDV